MKGKQMMPRCPPHMEITQKLKVFSICFPASLRPTLADAQQGPFLLFWTQQVSDPEFHCHSRGFALKSNHVVSQAVKTTSCRRFFRGWSHHPVYATSKIFQKVTHFPNYSAGLALVSAALSLRPKPSAQTGSFPLPFTCCWTTSVCPAAGFTVSFQSASPPAT